MMSQIDSRHWKISTSRHFQNGCHNTAKFQHCPISSKFDMWVDNDVPNWFLTSKNFYRSPFSKWPPQYRTNSTLSDFNAISYVGRLWCPELIPDIEKFLPIAIFKMAAKTRHKKWAVQIQHCPISSKFDMCVDKDVPIDSWHWKISTGRHFQNGCHNIAKIKHCPISSKFDMWIENDVPTLKNFYRSPFSRWPPQYLKNSTLSDIIKMWYVGR